MGIKGDLRSISLANVLQDLVMNEQTGTLRICQKERQIALWFEKGALRLVGLGPGQGPSPLNGLIALGKIPPEEAPPAVGRGSSERTLVRAAIRRKIITQDDLRTALQHQMGEHLCDAFLWPDATFEFVEGDPDDNLFDTDQLDLEPRLPVDQTIMDAARRVDEWGEIRKAVFSSGEILVGDPQILPADAEAITKRVFAYLDGERSLREIMELTRLGQFAVLRAAAQILKCGAAVPLSAADSLRRAQTRIGRKEWQAALKMARYGLDHERTNTGLLELALRCAEELDDLRTATGYARQLAAARTEQGALEAAVRSYQKVLALAPNDLTSRERLFDLLIRMDLKLDAFAAGEALAAAYKKGGLPDKALEVYRRLVEAVGSHTEILECVAEIERHLGDKKEAVGTYRQLVANALEARDDTAALEYCHAILKIDPRHDEARRLRQQLESGEMTRVRRRRRMVKAAIAAVVLLALLVACGIYEGKARMAYQEMRLTLLDAREAKRYAEALRLYDRVLDPYPWSLMARELGPERGQIEIRYTEEELASAADATPDGQLAEMIDELEKALELVRRGDLKEKVRVRLLELQNMLQEAEKEWGRRIAGMGPAEIGEIHDPMAAAALESCLARDQAAIRQAAVKALGGIESSRSDKALINALGDVDAAIKEEAARHLAGRHRDDPATQGFGTDQIKWHEWWGRRDRHPGKPPLQAILRVARQSFGPSESVSVEWQIANLATVEAEFAIAEEPAAGLRVTGQGATAVSLSAAGSGSRRTVLLGPGEFVGGSFDLSSATAAPGQYQLVWAAGIHWQGKFARVEASPLILERTP